MTQLRDERIIPLVWYTYGNYKLYCLELDKWYMKVFLRESKNMKVPFMVFCGANKKELIQKMDDYSLQKFGKIFKYRKVKDMDKLVARVPKVIKPKKPEQKEDVVVYKVDKNVDKKAEETSKKLLQFFSDSIDAMKGIYKLCLKGFIVLMILNLLLFVLLLLH